MHLHSRLTRRDIILCPHSLLSQIKHFTIKVNYPLLLRSEPGRSTARFRSSTQMGTVGARFIAPVFEKTAAARRDFQSHLPIYTAAATTPDIAIFAGKIGQELVQPGHLGIPSEAIRSLTRVSELFRRHLKNLTPSERAWGARCTRISYSKIGKQWTETSVTHFMCPA